MNEKLKEAIDTLKEFGFEPIKEAIGNRIKNPFFGGFIISWLFFNWDRILIICFSNASVIERINIIRKIPNNSIMLGFDIRNTHTLWYPLTISILFTLSSPFISYILEWAHKRVTTATEANRFSKQAEILDKKTLLTAAEVRSETQKDTALLEVKAKQEVSKAEIAQSAANIESLQSQVTSLTEQIKTYEQTRLSLEEEASSNREKLESSKKLLSDSENELSELNERLSDKKNIKKLISEKDAEIKKLKEQLNTIKSESNSFRFPIPSTDLTVSSKILSGGDLSTAPKATDSFLRGINLLNNEGLAIGTTIPNITAADLNFAPTKARNIPASIPKDKTEKE